MYEHVIAAFFRFDETETFLIVEPLNGANSHSQIVFQFVWRRGDLQIFRVLEPHPEAVELVVFHVVLLANFIISAGAFVEGRQKTEIAQQELIARSLPVEKVREGMS